MTTQIRIEIMHGNSFVTDDDRYRAEEAALAVLDAAGISVDTAAAEYKRQWLEFDDEDRMTGLALTWIKAGSAANTALTEGWRDPNGAGCTIAA